MASDAGTYAEQFGDEFQAHILATACRTPDFVLRFRSALDYTFFNSDSMRAISRALFAHVDEYRQIPMRQTLTEAIRLIVGEDVFEGIEETLDRLYDDDVSDATAVMARAVDFGKMQAMCNAVVESADFIDAGRREKVMPRIQLATLVGDDLLDIGIDYLGDPDRSFWYSKARELDTIPTGIAHLDFALGGGLGRGELGVVLAPPKRGKTTLLINFGFGALCSVPPITLLPGSLFKSGFSVAHYSCEISQTKVAMRYDDRLAGKLTKIKKSNPALYQQRLDERAARFLRGQLFIKSYPTRAASVSTLRSHLSALAALGFHPDLVIADYGDILRAERRLGDMRHEQAGIYEDLRALAGEFNCAVWTGSQAPRAALAKETLDMGDFAEAFEKAAIMDVGVAFAQTDDERIDGDCRLVLIGTRDVEDGKTIRCKIRRDRCRIESVGLYDQSHARVETPLDDDDDGVSQTAKRTATKLKGHTDGARATAKRKDAGRRKFAKRRNTEPQKKIG